MISLKQRRGVISVAILFTLLFIIPLSIQASGLSGKGSIQFNPEYKLRSYSGFVKVYTITEKGDRVEYTFKDFNADVLLLVYRKLDMMQITERMAKKYNLSKKASRRNVKRTINTLELWDIVIRS